MMQKAMTWVAYSLIGFVLPAYLPFFPQTYEVREAVAQPPTNVYIVNDYRSSTHNARRSLTVITIRNNRDLLSPNNPHPNTPGPCSVGILWRDLDGANRCTIAPIVISAGELKQFCSRRVSETSGIALCRPDINRNSAVCADDMELVESTGVAFVQVVDTPPCRDSLSVHGRVFYTPRCNG